MPCRPVNAPESSRAPTRRRLGVGLARLVAIVVALSVSWIPAAYAQPNDGAATDSRSPDPEAPDPSTTDDEGRSPAAKEQAPPSKAESESESDKTQETGGLDGDSAPSDPPSTQTSPASDSPPGSNPPGVANPFSKGASSATVPVRRPSADESEPPAVEVEAEPENKAQVSDPADPSPVLIRRRIVPPFWFEYEYSTHRTRALALPPLFVHRAPKADSPDNLLHADLSFTFGWVARDGERRKWINPFALFYGSYSDRETVWGTVPLLMGYKRVGEQFNFGQFPLFWWWGNRHAKNFLVLPLHFQQKTPSSRFSFTGMLFWYGYRDLDDADLENDRRHFVAAPVYFGFQRGQRRFDVSPLYLGGSDKIRGIRHRTLFPFFHWQSREFGNASELWTPLWVQRRDTARRKGSWAVPPLLTFSQSTPDRRLFSTALLFWRNQNFLEGSRTTVAGPLVLHRDPRQRNSVFAPLWWQFKDMEANVNRWMFLPLAAGQTTAHSRSVWTLIAGGMRDRRGGWGFAVPPLLTFSHRNPDGKNLTAVLGAFWFGNNPETRSRTVVLGPLAYGLRRQNDVRVGLPPLLTFVGQRGSRRHQVITPLFWHFRDREQAQDTWVIPPLYVHRERLGWHAGLPPVVFVGGGTRRYTILPFLLSGHFADARTRQATTITPLFVRTKGPDHRTLGILGLAWDVQRPRERHTTVFPFYYRRAKDEQVLHLSLIGGGRTTPERTTWVAGPVYGIGRGKTKGLGVLPLFFHQRRDLGAGKSATHSVLAPLWIRRRTPEDDLDMWSPLVWRSKVRGERPRSGLAIVPFYFRQRQPRGVDVDAGPVFFWSRDTRRRTHTVIGGPFYHRLSRKNLHTGVFPLWWWMDSEKKRRLFALPSIVHVRDKAAMSHTTIAIPFWFDRQRNASRRTWGAFPFAFGWRRGFNFVRFSIAPPGYVDTFNLRRNRRFVGFVPLLFRYQKCGFRLDDDPKCQYTVWGSFPLFLYGRDGQGRRTHGALLYYYDRTKEGFKVYTPVFGVNYSPGKTLGWYVPPLAVKTTREEKRVMFFPLYYRKAHRLKDRSLTLVIPPLYIGKRNEDRGWFEAGLLVWQFRQAHKVSTAIVPPLFYHSHSYAQRRLTWLLPFFLRDNKMSNDDVWTTVFPGLYVQRRKGEDLDFVQFPLVWHIERGENQGTFGAFVWWDIRTQGKTFQTVPALYTRFADSKGDTKIIGPGLGWWTRGRGERTGDRHWRALFGLFGGGVEKGRRYSAVMGFKFHRGPAKSPSNAKARRAARREARRELRKQRQARRLEQRLSRRRE